MIDKDHELLLDTPHIQLCWSSGSSTFGPELFRDLHRCNVFFESGVTQAGRVILAVAGVAGEGDTQRGWVLAAEITRDVLRQQVLPTILHELRLPPGDPRLILAAWLAVLAEGGHALVNDVELRDAISQAILDQLSVLEDIFFRPSADYQVVDARTLAQSERAVAQALDDLLQTWGGLTPGPLLWPGDGLSAVTLLSAAASSRWETPDFKLVVLGLHLTAGAMADDVDTDHRRLLRRMFDLLIGTIAFPVLFQTTPLVVRGLRIPDWRDVLRAGAHQTYAQWALCHASYTAAGDKELALPELVDQDTLQWLVRADTLIPGRWSWDVEPGGWIEQFLNWIDGLMHESQETIYPAYGFWEVLLPNHLGGVLQTEGCRFLRAAVDGEGMWLALSTGADAPARVVLRWGATTSKQFYLHWMSIVGGAAAIEIDLLATAFWRDLRRGGPMVFHQRPGPVFQQTAISGEPSATPERKRNRGRAVLPRYINQHLLKQTRFVAWGNEDDTAAVEAARARAPHMVRHFLRRLPEGWRASKKQQALFADLPLTVRLQLAQSPHLPDDVTFVPSHWRALDQEGVAAAKQVRAQGLLAVALLLNERNE